MIIEINRSYFDSLYNRARQGFYECIRLKENEFLREEIPGPLESIILKGTNIKIVFSQDIIDAYVLKICLTLFAANREVGKYTYYENEGGSPVDDSLVFY